MTVDAMAPWQQGKSLFQYIEQNIDKNGFFTSTSLPDGNLIFPDPSFILELGATDAYFSMSADADNEKMTLTVYQRIHDFIDNPTDNNKKILYKTVAAAQCITYCESLVDLLAREDLPASLMRMAVEWLLLSPNREAVKFAIVICGLFNISAIEKNYKVGIKANLLLLARCDEFTFFVIFAFNLSNITTEKDLWGIIKSTRGWGKVHALEAATYNTKAKKEWLLRHGSELNVIYPGISLLCIRQGDMLETLKREKIDRSLYDGILNTLNNFLLFLIDYENSDSEYTDLESIYTVPLLKEILRHAKHYSNSIEDLIGIINLSGSLQVLAYQNRWDTIHTNECHILISETEKLIFHKNWLHEIKKKILRPDGSINYLIIDFAYALHIDIEKLLLMFLHQRPEETELYRYLLQTNNKRVFNDVLNFARKHLAEYRSQENSLQPIVQTLERHPGEGADFIMSALTSLYDWPRANALGTLEAWGVEYLTPPIKVALLKAKTLAQHTLLRLRIEALLNNKILDIEQSLEDLFNK